MDDKVNLADALAAFDEPPAGVEHCPRADSEAHVLLIEREGTPNTGDSSERAPAPERHL